MEQMTAAQAHRPEGPLVFTISDDEFELFRGLIHRETGIFLKDTKRSLVTSRLGKRLRQLGLRSFSQYYRLLANRDPRGDERQQMTNCITTNKTSFFREEHHFRFLREHLAGLARRTGPGPARPWRIWSAACSSGEEPYSIAITVLESLGSDASSAVRILASDIDTEMLEQGAQGVYPGASLEGVSETLRRKYFLRGKGAFEGLMRVKPELRRLVAFRRINLVREPWPVQGRFTAIFCRNVIIYFDRPTQRRLFERLVRHLEEDGLLFVGHSENLHWLTDLVTPVGHTIYKARPAGTRR